MNVMKSLARCYWAINDRGKMIIYSLPVAAPAQPTRYDEPKELRHHSQVRSGPSNRKGKVV
jgi:hypothetical protein